MRINIILQANRKDTVLEACRIIAMNGNGDLGEFELPGGHVRILHEIVVIERVFREQHWKVFIIGEDAIGEARDLQDAIDLALASLDP